MADDLTADDLTSIGAGEAQSLREELADQLAIDASDEEITETETGPEAPADDTRGTSEPSDAAPSSDTVGEQPSDADTEAETEPSEAAKPSAPEHWPAEDREAFSKLPDDAKGVLLAQSKRMEDAHRERSEQLAETRKLAERFEPIAKDLEPFRQQLALQGVDDVGFLRSLVAAHNSLTKDAPGTLAWLASRYKADPVTAIRQIAQSAKLDLATLDIDETEDIIRDPRVDELDQRVKKIDEDIGQQQQAQWQEAQASAARRLEAFRDAKDDRGAPLHPHFADVEADMAALARAEAANGNSIDLDALYERAVWMNPAVRQKALEQRDKARQAEAERKRKEQAKRAKAASTEVKAAPDGGAGAEPVSLRDALRAGLRGGVA